jgi:protein gp37
VADRSSIEWTEATWNPTTGCDRVSLGCDNCYALTLAKRLKAMGAAKYQNDGNPRTSGPGFDLTTHPQSLRLPYTWRAPRLVFVNSMSDLSGGVAILNRPSPQVKRSECASARARQVSWTGVDAR